jgi:2,6-dihydroxypseudooxynicotine hydrolase
VTGLPGLPANQLEIATNGWAPRLLAHGVDPNDYRRITAGLETWDGWLDAWVESAEAHAAIAIEADGRGWVRTAGDAFVRAALYLHFGAFLWLEDPARYRATTDRAADLHQQGMTRLDPSFERLEIPFADDRVVANLRRPLGVDRPPLMILVPGLDSTKEEFPLWEATFLDRGLATVSLDGPGQGEAGVVNPIRPDYELPVAALLDVLERRMDLDPGRVGITGIGLGGYYAARAAAFEPRITAVGVVGGAYQFARMPAIIRRKFMYSAHLTEVAAAASLAERFSLDGIAARIRQPYLVIHGGGDAVMDAADARRPTLEAARGEFKLYPDGNTVCQNVSHLFKPFLADWLGEKLREA